MKFLKLASSSIFVLMFFALVRSQTADAFKSPEEGLEDLLRANAYQIQIKNGALSGSGVTFLANSLDNVQFVALGEAHNKRAVHQFGEALFRLLHDKYKFNYLALEEDPYWEK